MQYHCLDSQGTDNWAAMGSYTLTGQSETFHLGIYVKVESLQYNENFLTWAAKSTSTGNNALIYQEKYDETNVQSSLTGIL